MSFASYHLITEMSNVWDTMKKKYTKEEVEEMSRTIQRNKSEIAELKTKKDHLERQLQDMHHTKEKLKEDYEKQIEKYQMQIEKYEMQIEALTNENLELQQMLQEKKKGERIYVHPAFSDRIFEVCCMIGMEHYMFSQIVKSQLIEEKLLRLKKMDNVYKNATEATKRRIEEEVKKKAIEFFEDYYKSHGLFIVYGNIETLLSDKRSKILGLEESEQKLLNRLVPGRFFLDENTKEYLKEISVLDGAVCVDPFGIVKAAARYLIIDREITLSQVKVYKGFGTKNVTALCITKELSDIVAYTISGRSKLVRQFVNGELVREFNPITGKLSVLENGEIVEQYQFDVRSYFKGSEEINEHIDVIYKILEEQLGQKNKEIVESVMYKLHKITQRPYVVSKQFYLKDGKKVEHPDKTIEETHVAENGVFQEPILEEKEKKEKRRGQKKKKEKKVGGIEITP